MGWGQEREPVEIVLVVDFDAFDEAGSRVTGHDQADQHAIHVHLIAVRRSPAAKRRPLGKLELIAASSVMTSPVKPSATGIGRPRLMALMMSKRGPLSVVTVVRRHAQGLVDAERLGVAHQHREQDVGAEVGHVVEHAAAQVERMTLRSDEAGVEQRQRIAANLHIRARTREAGDDVAASTVCVCCRVILERTRSRLSVDFGLSTPLCGMPFGKMSVIGTSRAIEKRLKPVNTSFPGGRRAPGFRQDRCGSS